MTLSDETRETPQDAPYLVVLGIAQDGGYPQAGCSQSCCQRAWTHPDSRRHVVCIAAVDPTTQQRWLFDCTPDFREQLRELDRISSLDSVRALDGILLTHAHVGHYAGLIHLGREAMSARRIPVHTMPRMRRFLESNRPWSQLVSDRNVVLHDLADGRTLKLNERIAMTPFLVPHRDEYSETVGFRINGPNRSALFLPDIDNWDHWDTKIEDLLRGVDVAWLDGTFYSDCELPGRDISQISHPCITESIERFTRLPGSERNKVRFLHFNHTNPVLDPQSQAAQTVRDAGLHLATQGQTFAL